MKRSKSDEKGDAKGKLKHCQQFKAVETVVDENKVTTERYNGPANCSKKFVWKSRQQEYHFQKAKQIVATIDGKTSKSHELTTTSESKINVSGSLNANAFRQPNVLTSRNDQNKYVATDNSKAWIHHRGESNWPLVESKQNAVATYANSTFSHKPGLSNPSTIIKKKSMAKSNAFHPAMSNKKLVSDVVINAKTSKGPFKNSMFKDALEGSDKLQISLKKPSDAKTISSIQQRVKRHRLSGKKNTSPKLNIQHSQKQFLSNYNALFMKRHLKVGHNSRKRILHRPEISYIYEDKMCWFKPRRFQQPRRLLKYRYAAKLTEDLNPLSTGSLLLPPKVNLECHIFGLPKSMQRFNDCFKRLCEIIGVEDMHILNVRNENGAKVIQLADSNQRNNFLTAYENYQRLVKFGTVLPLTLELCGGVAKKKKVRVQPGPKNITKGGQKDKPVEKGIEIRLSGEDWASVLYRQKSTLVSATDRRDYGALINASNILCHAF